MEKQTGRERWATRIGLVLAMAGNAIGLGNFLRFPVQAARNGGGVFMVPYFLSFLLMGIPLMWMEWAIGRLGGSQGHGTTPGMFQILWRHRLAKYLGVVGIFGPLVIMFYYTWIESWTFAYAARSLLGRMPQPPVYVSDVDQYVRPFETALANHLGINSAGALNHPSLEAYVFFVLTMILNLWILHRGIAKGIEALAKVAMPALFVFALVLVVRVFTLGEHQGGTPFTGLGYLWNPRLTIERDGVQKLALLDGGVWVAAAGQIFFTLSLGMGAIPTYASYLRRRDDVVLSGLSTSTANEFAEVICGGSIAIPAAVCFFGLDNAIRIATNPNLPFGLGFVALPAIFAQFGALGSLLGGLWFLLLFFAGFTSSVALLSPAIAFLQDELGWARRQAVWILGGLCFAVAHMCIFLKECSDQMDFWAGSFLPVLCAFVEAVLFMWVFGADRAWEEMHHGAAIRIPRFFYYVMRYVTPLFLAFVLGIWVKDKLILPLLGAGESEILQASPTAWVTRAFLVGLFAALCLMVRHAWRKRGEVA